MRFVDIDQADAGEADALCLAVRGGKAALSVEAQEAANQHLYEEALTLQSAGERAVAADAYRRLLAQDLITRAEGKISGDTLDRQERPAILLKFLALRNLAELQEAAGALQSAVDCLLVAVQLQERDAVLWQRLGSIALRTGQRHLARLSLEQSIACSPHHQLAAMRLRQVLGSLGDGVGLAQLHEGTARWLPHLAPHLPDPRALSPNTSAIACTRATDGVAAANNAHCDDEDVHRRSKRPRKEAGEEANAEERVEADALVVELPRVSWEAVATALLQTWHRLGTKALPRSLGSGDGARDGARHSEPPQRPTDTIPAATAATAATVATVATAATVATHDDCAAVTTPPTTISIGRRITFMPPAAVAEHPRLPTSVEADAAVEGEEASGLGAGSAAAEPTIADVAAPADVVMTDGVMADAAIVDEVQHASKAFGAASIATAAELGAAEEVEVALAHAVVTGALATALLTAKKAAEPSRRQPSRSSRKKVSTEAAVEPRGSPSKKAKLGHFCSSAAASAPLAPRLELLQLLAQFVNATPLSAVGVASAAPAATRAAAGATIDIAAAPSAAAAAASSPVAQVVKAKTAEAEAVVVTEAEEHAVRMWLASEQVRGNSGVLHVSSLLFARVLSDEVPGTALEKETSGGGREDGQFGVRCGTRCGARDGAGGGAKLGFGWFLASMSTASRARLGRALLALHEGLGETASSWGMPPVPIAISLLEMQLDAASAGLEPSTARGGGGGRASSASLRALSAQLSALGAALRYGGGAVFARDGGGSAALAHDGASAPFHGERTDNEWRLRLRLAWAQATCEELRGGTTASTSWLHACHALLVRSPRGLDGGNRGGDGNSGEGDDDGDLGSDGERDSGAHAAPVRPIPLLRAPVVLETALIKKASARQEQQRLRQAAIAALAVMRVHSSPCVGGEWLSELCVAGQRADGGAAQRCLAAWKIVLSMARSEAASAEKHFGAVELAMASDAFVSDIMSLVEADDSPLNKSLEQLHLCWIGLCEAASAAAVKAVAAVAPSAAAAAAASADEAEGAMPPATAPWAALTDLLEVYDDSLRSGLLASEQAAAVSAAASATAASAPTMALGANPVTTIAPLVDERVGGLSGAVERRLEHWLLRLMQSLDAFRSSVRYGAFGTSHEAVVTAEMAEAEAAGAKAEAAKWGAAADRLLPRLAALVQHGAASPVSRVLLHYATTAFIKVWLLRPNRPSEQSLLLLEGAWKAVTALGATPLPLPLAPRGHDGGVEGRGMAAAAHAAARSVRLDTPAGRRHEWEAPLAQLCLATALDELHAGTVSSARLDVTKIESLHERASRWDGVGGGGGDVGVAGDDDEGLKGGGGSTEADERKVLCTLGAEETEKRTAVFHALEDAFRRSWQEELVGDVSLGGVSVGWVVRWKARHRKVAGGASGDAYMISPSGDSLDSMKKVEVYLGLGGDGAHAADSATASSLPISMTKPQRGVTHVAKMPPNAETRHDGLRGFGMAEPQTVRDGWEALLHASCQHLHGTRADAMSPAARVVLKVSDLETDRLRRDERRRALQVTAQTSVRMTTQYSHLLNHQTLARIPSRSPSLVRSRAISPPFAESRASRAPPLARILAAARTTTPLTRRRRRPLRRPTRGFRILRRGLSARRPGTPAERAAPPRAQGPGTPSHSTYHTASQLNTPQQPRPLWPRPSAASTASPAVPPQLSARLSRLSCAVSCRRRRVRAHAARRVPRARAAVRGWCLAAPRAPR